MKMKVRVVTNEGAELTQTIEWGSPNPRIVIGKALLALDLSVQDVREATIVGG